MRSIIFTFLFLFFIQSYSDAQIGDTVLARQYLDSLKYNLENRKTDKAITFGNKALEIYINTFSEENLFVASTYFQLAKVSRVCQLNEAFVLTEKALNIWKKILGPRHSKVSDCYRLLGFLHDAMAEYEKSWLFFEKSIEIDSTIFGKDHPRIGKSFEGLGNICLVKGKYLQAIDYYEKGLRIFQGKYKNGHPKIAVLNHNIGEAYISILNLNKAIKHTQKAIEEYSQFYGRNNHRHLKVYENLGIIYFLMGKYDEALEFYEKALSIARKWDILWESREMYNLYNNIGDTYASKGDYRNALIYSIKTLDHNLKALGKYQPQTAETYYILGLRYSELKEYEEALHHVNMAKQIWRHLFGEEHLEYLKSIYLIGNIYKRRNDFNSALKIFDEVLNRWEQELHPELAKTYINIGDIKEGKRDFESAVENYEKALDVWKNIFGNGHPEIANTYHKIAKVHRNKKEYPLALQSFENAIHSLTLFNQSATNRSSKQFHLSKSYPIFEDAIGTVFEANEASPEQFNLKDAFTFAERSKANLLQEALNKNHAEEFSGLPDSLLEKEYNLKIDIALFDRKKFEELEKGSTKNDSLIIEYNSRIFDLKEQLNVFIQQLERDYPEYFKLKYKSEVATVEEVQTELLEANHALLEYFVGNREIYIFLITPKDYQVFKVDKNFPLNDRIKQMRNGLYHYHLSGKDDETSYKAYADTFAVASFQLYEKLLAPFEKGLPEKLIIIPDGVLNYIPFEVLLKQKPKENHQFKNHVYFIKDHQISYSYSATFLLELKRKKNKASKGLLAFAPSFESDDQLLASVEARRNGLGPLLFSVPEVESIHEIFGGEVYLGASATEENFTRLAENYSILHLATHGKANDQAGDYSYLAFTEIEDSLENEFLYVRDLYNMKLNADMVVLSACETGLGELQRGEGVVSLARGFSYAGAKSIITTLWSVSDENTKDLMLPFYQNIKSGMDKDAALRKAKLDYIEQNAHLNAHPFYWAGLIALGNMEPVNSDASFGGLMGYGLLALVSVLILFWLFRRNQNA